MTLSSVTQTACARIPTEEGEFRLCHYSNSRDEKEHLALVLGDVAGCTDLLVRVHSECFTGDVLGSQRCDCGPQLHSAMRLIAQAGSGLIIYLRQEGRGIGLAEKLAAYGLQDQGYDTVDANLLLGHEADQREYWAAAGILQDLEVQSIRLLTNNPDKIEQLCALGVEVTGRVPLETPVTEDNAVYLSTKVQRMRHLLTLPDAMAEKPSTTLGLQSDIEKRISNLRHDARTFYRRHGRPFVTLSYAQSLDGSIASASGKPLRISSPQSMTMTHALRAAHDAILVGINTVLADDPSLTVRLVEGNNPQPIVLDSNLRMPAQARLLAHPKGVWLATGCTDSQHRNTLSQNGTRVLELPVTGAGQVDLYAFLERLGQLGIASIMVEGGSQVLSNFLSQGLADYAVVTVAPIFVGGLRAFEYTNSNTPGSRQTPMLRELVSTPVGPDLVLWGKPTFRSLDTES